MGLSHRQCVVSAPPPQIAICVFPEPPLQIGEFTNDLARDTLGRIRHWSRSNPQDDSTVKRYPDILTHR